MAPASRDQSQKQRLRQAFGAFATGVTVVTALDADGVPTGFTANSFTSVSLDPPLLLVCLGKSSSKLETFSNAKSFAVNILAATQSDVSNRFAAPVGDRFANIGWRPGAQGAPILDDTAAWFDCTPHRIVDAGDHIIMIGHIDAFAHAEREPLIFLRGQYLRPPCPAETLAVSPRGSHLRAGSLLGYMDQVLLEADGARWTVPMSGRAQSLRAARASLENRLAGAGLDVHWNLLYSVFDDPDRSGTWMFFQGALEPGASIADGFQLFDLDDIPFGKITSRGVEAMLRRYRQEHRSGAFGLYADGARHSGYVARFAGAAAPWRVAMKTKDTIT